MGHYVCVCARVCLCVCACVRVIDKGDYLALTGILCCCLLWRPALQVTPFPWFGVFAAMLDDLEAEFRCGGVAVTTYVQRVKVCVCVCVCCVGVLCGCVGDCMEGD